MAPWSSSPNSSGVEFPSCPCGTRLLGRPHSTLLVAPSLATVRRPCKAPQTIAADLFDRCGASALRFPSRLDGQPALVVFEGRGELVEAGEPIALTDPAPEALLAVCREWGLELESTYGR